MSTFRYARLFPLYGCFSQYRFIVTAHFTFKATRFFILIPCEYSLGHLCGYSSAKHPKNPTRRNGRHLGLCRYSGGLRYFVGRDVGTFRWGTGIGASTAAGFRWKTHFLGVDVYRLYLGHTRFFRCSFYPFGSLGVFSSTQNREVNFELWFAPFSWSSHYPCLYSPNTGAGCRGWNSFRKFGVGHSFWIHCRDSYGCSEWTNFYPLHQC